MDKTIRDDSPAISLKDCLKLADETKELILKPEALNEIPGLLEKFFGGKAPCLIADENTMKAAGFNVVDVLKTSGVKFAGKYIFPGEPHLHADYDHVSFLRKWIISLPDFPLIVPLAVGAGTCNDIVKRAAFELELPYMCIPTAASVDGFTSNGAALLVDGFKQTLPCTAPLVVTADTNVIANAPACLSSSGFGDLAGKIIAGTDWIIAEKAGEAGAPEAPAIDPVCWTMIQNGLLDALEASVEASGGNPDAVNTLFRSLAITGFSMQYYKNSRPVSGSEHLFSHVWEMDDLSLNGVPVTHGHKVGIGTLTAAAFTEIFFAKSSGPPDAPKGFKRPSLEERFAEVSSMFGENPASESIKKTALEKFMDDKKANLVNQAFRDSWSEIRERVSEKLIPYGELKTLLEKAGCPVVPEAIGLKRTQAIAATRKAQMIRNKYCILDLAWDMGTFEGIMAKIEESNSYLK